jgi:hypothetical protein
LDAVSKGKNTLAMEPSTEKLPNMMMGMKGLISRSSVEMYGVKIDANFDNPLEAPKPVALITVGYA